MKNYQKLILAATALTAGSLSAQELVGSFNYGTDNALDVSAVQSAVIGASRTTEGDVGTGGVVAGEIGIFGGGTVGVSGYAGVTSTSFGVGSYYTRLNRNGDKNGGLLTFDYDFSTYLATNAAGTGAGEYIYSVGGSYVSRRGDSRVATFYISYNDGASQILDTTLVTDIAITGADELVAQTANYTSIGTIGTTDQIDKASGTLNLDITSYLEASTDGRIRIAYLDNTYYGKIAFRDGAGVVANAVVPEPSTYGMVPAADKRPNATIH